MHKLSFMKPPSRSPLRLESLCELRTGIRPLTSASGLVYHDGWFYAVGDKERDLFRFPHPSAAPSASPPWLVSIPGPPALPHPDEVGQSLPKKRKPDFEALTVLDGGDLLALPSGSKPNRVQGALWTLNDFRETEETPATSRIVDFSPLFRDLRVRIPELNLEGMASQGGETVLLQRGNGDEKHNSLLLFRSDLFMADVRGGLVTDASFTSEFRIDLGRLKGFPLSFTDAATDSSGSVWFLAAAEATESTYDDGDYLGAVLGVFSRDWSVSGLWELDAPAKPEGLWILGSDFFVVTDADDEKKPSWLLRGDLPRTPASSAR